MLAVEGFYLAATEEEIYKGRSKMARAMVGIFYVQGWTKNGEENREDFCGYFLWRFFVRIFIVLGVLCMGFI